MKQSSDISHDSLDIDELMPEIYDELRKIARMHIRKLAPGQSLEPTELVHKAYIALAARKKRPWKNKRHFRAIAARKLYEVLIDYLRHKAALRHGGGKVRVDITMTLPAAAKPVSQEDFLWLHRRLDELQERYPREAEIVILRFFGGFTVREVADHLEMTTAKVEKCWSFCRALMCRDGKTLLSP